MITRFGRSATRLSLPSLALCQALCLGFFALACCVARAQTPQHGALLVVTKQSHALAIVDGDTLQVLAQVPIGEDPHEVVVGPDNRTALVSNYGEGTLRTIARVDLAGRKPLPAFDISPLKGPHGLKVHGETLWFTAGGSMALGTLDPATGRITAVVGTGQENTHLVWVSRDGKRLVASNAGSGTLSIFDRVEIKPNVVAGAPQPPSSYTTEGWSPRLVPDGMGAEGFDVSPDESEAWAGDAQGHITVVDLADAKVLATLSPDVPGANRIRFTPDGRFVLVTTHTGKDLVVLDAHTRTVVKRIPIEERGASGIQVEPNGDRAFVACPRDHYVAVVDLKTMTMTGKIEAGREPDGLAWWQP